MSATKGDKDPSYRTQIIIALIGLAGVLGSALLANWDKLFPPKPPPTPAVQGASTKPSGSKPIIPGRRKPVTDTGKPERTTPAPIGGPISVSVNNVPRVIPPGGRTSVSVLATARDNSMIPGARVVLTAGGGVFDETGTTRAVGQTNDKGVYHTTWRTYEPDAYTGNMSYVIDVQVSKDGFTTARGQTEVFIRK